MSDSQLKPPEHAALEALLRIPLPGGMVEDAGTLVRAATPAARAAAAGMPLDARDPTDFLAVLESLGLEHDPEAAKRG
ncbi:MAG: hypothetical protein AAB223_03065 [Pseudomonadota bacterium]